MSVSKFMEVAANRDYSKEWQAPGSFPWVFQRPQEAIARDELYHYSLEYYNRLYNR